MEVKVQELMSSVCAALCRDGSEALRLILGRECCSSSMEDRICRGHDSGQGEQKKVRQVQSLLRQMLGFFFIQHLNNLVTKNNAK